MGSFRLTKDTKKNVADMPKWVSAMFFVDETRIDGNKCYYIRPKEGFKEEYFFYVYDGDEGCISNSELRYILNLASYTGWGIYLPLYSYENKNEKAVISFLRTAYKDFTKSFADNGLIAVSTGFGSVLLLKILINSWKSGVREPDKLIMVAPEMSESDSILSDDDRVYTEFCKDITICQGVKSEYRNAVRNICGTLHDFGLDVKLFEYDEAKTDFYLHPAKHSTIHMKRILSDMILGEYSAAISGHMYEIKRRADITKKYKSIFRDEKAVRFISKNKILFKKRKRIGKYEDILLASSYRVFDDSVKLFLKEYPNGTVVYLGCSLDTMYDRVDNGRVTWYNLDRSGRMAIRKMFTEAGEREHNIEKTVDDLSWMDDIKSDTGFGLLILCRNIFVYYSAKEVKEYINKIYEKFPGAQVIFDISNQATLFRRDFYEPDNDVKIRSRKYFVSHPDRAVTVWNPAFRLVWEKSMLEGIKLPQGVSRRNRIKFWLDNADRKYKIVKIVLGTERYKQYHNIYKEK